MVSRFSLPDCSVSLFAGTLNTTSGIAPFQPVLCQGLEYSGIVIRLLDVFIVNFNEHGKYYADEKVGVSFHTWFNPDLKAREKSNSELRSQLVSVV